jgi:aromatic amino acid aminotransferase I
MLLDRGDGILVEEYAYTSAMEQLVPLGIVPVPVRIDRQGMDPGDISRAHAQFKLAHPINACRVLYVVPTGHNPTGAVMSM